ncbi:epoxyqueuosine reductase [Thermoproteota archaeon]
MKKENPGEFIRSKIRKFVASPSNTMKKWDNEKAWGDPIVGFSSGADPLYKFYKKDIGDFYISPLEFLLHHYPDTNMEENKITVISWILPQTEWTKKDHRGETHFPSERWARSRIFGEEFNVKLRQYVADLLINMGIKAVAPMLSPLYVEKLSPKYGRASNWSERHAAYAAGLGSFGLSDGLITPVGKAMRAGSIVANMYVEPTERKYENHNAYCLFYMKNRCGKCIDRCPIGAITENGHDKALCSRYVGMTRKYVEKHYGFKGYGCGLCQTDVPCESRIPEELILR